MPSSTMKSLRMRHEECSNRVVEQIRLKYIPAEQISDIKKKNNSWEKNLWHTNNPKDIFRLAAISVNEKNDSGESFVCL